jgi:uroporphyrinogen decarboxylase
VIAGGSQVEVKQAVEEVLKEAPERFILGADCTVPSDTRWDNLKLAVSIAHAYQSS